MIELAELEWIKGGMTVPMDHFMEEVVVKKQRGMQDGLYYMSTAIMIVFAIVGFSMLSSLLMGFSVEGLLLTALSIGVAVLMFLRKDRIRTEYEYTFTNGDLDFAQVFNNQKRKSLGTMRVKNVEAFGKVAGADFHKLVNMPDLLRKNWFLNRGADLYYFYFQKDGKKTMIILEPSQELAEMIRKYLPHGAYRA